MSEPDYKRQRKSLKHTVKIIIGSGDTYREFDIPRSYATQSSRLIQACLRSDSHEEPPTQEEPITLAELDPEAFEGYISWLYTKDVTLDINASTLCETCVQVPQALPGDDPYECGLELAEMYMLGLQVQDHRFCNAVADDIQQLVQSGRCAASPEAASLVWQKTGSGSPIRELFLTTWCRAFGRSHERVNHVLKEHVEIPRAFVVDLLEFTAKQQENIFIFSGEQEASHRCKYHIHDDDDDDDNVDKCT